MFIAAAEFAYARIMRCGSATRAAAFGVQRVDHVAAVRRAGPSASVAAERGLVYCPATRATLTTGMRRAVGQHDRHLQQRARVGQQVALGVVGERLGAVAALQQERPALAHLGEPVPAAGRPRTARRSTGRCRAPGRPSSTSAGSGHGGICVRGRSRHRSRPSAASSAESVDGREVCRAGLPTPG